MNGAKYPVLSRRQLPSQFSTHSVYTTVHKRTNDYGNFLHSADGHLLPEQLQYVLDYSKGKGHPMGGIEEEQKYSCTLT